MKSVLATIVLVLAMASPAEAAGLTPGQCADRFPVAAGSVARLAAAYDIPPTVVWAIVVIESGCNHLAEGPYGEVGLGQIIPKDQTRWPVRWFSHRPTRRELLDPIINANTIVYELARNARRFCGGQLDCAIAVYRGGTRPSAVAWRYSARVLALAGGMQ